MTTTDAILVALVGTAVSTLLCLFMAGWGSK